MEMRKVICGLMVMSVASSAFGSTFAFANNGAIVSDVSCTSNGLQKSTVEEYLSEESQMSRGTSRPSGSSYIDLSSSDYSYTVSSFTRKLYTNSQFSGVDGMNVYVGHIFVDKDGSVASSGPVGVSLCSGLSVIETKSVDVPGEETVTFTGLDKDKKYYIRFSKDSDKQIYSFVGTISEN